jgi:hypothetical protein
VLNKFLFNKKKFYFLFFIFFFLLIIFFIQFDKQSIKPNKYRLIFNSDGNAVFKDANGNIDKWISNIFDPLKESGVDALFWCDGAGGNTANYVSEVLELTGSRNKSIDPNLQKLINQNIDLPQLVINEAKKRGLDIFYSYRLNDIHDRFMPEELPNFKIKNPNWIIGPMNYDGIETGYTSLNFALEEVRNLKISIIDEIINNYNFDGIEIDFMRSPPFFKPEDIHSKSYLMDDFLAKIKDLIDKKTLISGKKKYLAVRINESLIGAKKDGLDVQEWVKRSLVDYIILGSGAMTINIKEFKKITKNSKILVYPTLYGWPSWYNPIPENLARGLALNYYNQQPDGLYLFNWFPHDQPNSELDLVAIKSHKTLLKEIYSSDKILSRKKNIMFAAERGKRSWDYPNNWLDVELPKLLIDNETIKVEIIATINDKIKKDIKESYLKIETENDEINLKVKFEKKYLKPIKNKKYIYDLNFKKIKDGKNIFEISKLSKNKQFNKTVIKGLELHLVY